MEKVTISKIKEVAITGKAPFWSCECPNGSKYTVWDAGIAGMIGQNLNIECEADTKQSGNFWNIRQFKPINITPQSEKVIHNDGNQECFVNPPELMSSQTTSRLMSEKDSSIVSQVCLKCATEIIVKGAYQSGNQLGQDLNEIMNELIGAYKEGVRLLNV